MKSLPGRIETTFTHSLSCCVREKVIEKTMRKWHKQALQAVPLCYHI